MRPKLLTLAVVDRASCSRPVSSSSSPSPSGGASSPAASARRPAAPSSVGQRGGRRLGPRIDHRDGRPVRLALVARGGRGADPDAPRLPGRLPEHHGRLPADRRRLPDGDDRQVRRRRRAGPLLRQRRVRARSGSTRASSQPLDDYIAKSGFDTSQFFPGYAVDLQGQGRQDLRPPQGRQHHRAWPTTPTS